MSIDFDSESKLNLIGARWTANTLDMCKDTPQYIASLAFHRLRSQLAALLSREAMRVTPNAYSIDYEIRLYVLTPDQLEKYVQRRARRMGYMPSSVVEQTYEPGSTAP